MNDISSAEPATEAPPRPAPAMPWHRRFVQAVLYGRNVDRDRKARARLGLAVVGFALVYAIIAGKLVIFAIAPDSHVARRGSSDAVATARPNILDRNGEVLAPDVRRPSLFAEPRRIYDADVDIELLTSIFPDLDTKDLRVRLASKRGFTWLKRDVTPQQQADIKRVGIPAIGFLTENKRVYPNGAEVSHELGYVNVENQGVSGLEKWLDDQGLAELHKAGFASDRQHEPGVLSLDLRRQAMLRGEVGGGHHHGCALGGSDRHGVRARLRPEFRARGGGARSRPRPQARAGRHGRDLQSPDQRPVRDGLDLQGLHDRDGARLRALQSQFHGGCARAAALRAANHPRLSRDAPPDQPLGGVHLFFQYRRRDAGSFARGRGASGVLAQAGAARSPADRAAGKP